MGFLNFLHELFSLLQELKGSFWFRLAPWKGLVSFLSHLLEKCVKVIFFIVWLVLLWRRARLVWFSSWFMLTSFIRKFGASCANALHNFFLFLLISVSFYRSVNCVLRSGQILGHSGCSMGVESTLVSSTGHLLSSRSAASLLGSTRAAWAGGPWLPCRPLLRLALLALLLLFLKGRRLTCQLAAPLLLWAFLYLDCLQ